MQYRKINTFSTSILTTLIVVIMALRQVSSYTQTCIKEYCFTTPDASQLIDFNSAKSWCTNNGSTLAVINDSDVQQALTQFLKSSNMNSLAFINVKLYQHDNSWFLVNGSLYNGFVGNQATANYRLYSCLRPYGNLFNVEASQPSEMNRYICEFQDCLNSPNDNILYNGRCYVKYESETLTWYKARERCINNGGDLATFQVSIRPAVIYGYNPPFNTSWLNSSFTYWIGIRWNDWRWKTPDGGNETIYTSWSSGKPNNYNFQCVCVDPNGNPAWSWTDCDCGQTRQFVCLRIVPTTTTFTTRTTTTGQPVPTTNATSVAIADINPKSTTNAITLGLVLGIILPLIIVIIVLSIIIIHLRRQSRETDRNDERAATTVKTSQINVERSAARTNAPDPDINYQHLKRETMFGPGTSMPMYDQLSQPDNRDYELPS